VKDGFPVIQSRIKVAPNRPSDKLRDKQTAIIGEARRAYSALNAFTGLTTAALRDGR
jgi:hypothetical protein